MRETFSQRLAALLYRLMVYGGGGLGVLFLVAPIVIALLMSLTAVKR